MRLKRTPVYLAVCLGIVVLLVSSAPWCWADNQPLVRLEGEAIHAFGVHHGKGIVWCIIERPFAQDFHSYLRIYRVQDGAKVFEVNLGLKGLAAIDPSGTFFVTTNYAGERLGIIDWATARIIREVPVPVRAVYQLAVSDDGKKAAVVGEQFTIAMIDLKSSDHRTWKGATIGERLKEFFTVRLHGSPSWNLRHLTFLPGNEILAAVRDDGIVFAWDLSGNILLNRKLADWSDQVPGVTLLDDRTVYASRQRGGTFEVVRVADEHVLFTAHDDAYYISNNGALLSHSHGAPYLLLVHKTSLELKRLPSMETVFVKPLTPMNSLASVISTIVNAAISEDAALLVMTRTVVGANMAKSEITIESLPK